MPLKEIASFNVKHLSILDENGQWDEDLDPKLSDDDLIKLYRAMVKGREADQRMLKMQRQGRLGTFPPTTGHEAVICGATFATRDDDWLVGSYREMPGRLMRGEPLERTLHYYNGREEGSALSAAHHLMPIQVILGSQLPHAVGMAYAMRYKGEQGRAVVCFFGDGASSQGDFHEALNFASVWQAPVVFVCQNNQWAISVPLACQTRSQTIAQKAIAYQIPCIQVDGNDALATYKATKDALDRARSGGGPTLIEMVTYRLIMHTTADDPSKYRSADEEKTWWDKDPIPRLFHHLKKIGVWDDQKQALLEEDVKNEVNQAVKNFESEVDFKPDAPFDHVFETPSAALEEQRALFLSNLRDSNNA
ncbi:pyruvate dehydrogenase (acetyl-transferring) E1 component subunit alpha [Myxococcota bacterium]|nr:pyruvate dehydrogenase (acetyl-transferring) E1 component subunit alpha [Myxococcota bacterium]MBU1431845.1 pyruvate dehydrogenase (acetyl-transferring) E1 component subunit alpha [Myxococcota bacterium]MBU1899455.1 pyruvate dehydrogenase (acetyl-transferring) E1 component subunit alpha [Myxococcota bacterium]